MNTANDTVIIYHDDCPDGFSAAWSAWRKFGSNATYYGAKQNTPPPDIAYGNKNIFLLDYSYNKEYVQALRDSGASISLIDHHATSKGRGAEFDVYVHDVNHCGSTLSWKYWHPDSPVPTLLRYVEEGDLWRFNLPNAHEISESIRTIHKTFENWNEIYDELESEKGFEKHLARGQVSLERTAYMVEKAVEEAEEIEFEGYKCLAVNSMFCVSEIGAALYSKMPPIAIIWSHRGTRTIVSFRSDGTVDVSKLAKKYGGGGHPAAAGFVVENKGSLMDIISE